MGSGIQVNDYMEWQNVDLNEDVASNEGMRAIRYYAHRLQEAQNNPNLRSTVQAQLQINNLIPLAQEERTRSLERQESPSRRGRNFPQHGNAVSPPRRRGRRVAVENNESRQRLGRHEDALDESNKESDSDRRRFSDEERAPR